MSRHPIPTPTDRLPFLDLKTPHRELSTEILAVWERILHEASFVGGPEVEGFEKEFAAFASAQHAVGVASGTAALRLALLALGLKPGDEVILPAHTFIATAEAVTQAGGRPVLVDVDGTSGTLAPERVEEAITPRSRVLLPVHLYGQPADMDPLCEIARRHGLRVLEDAAQAHGAEYHGRRAGSLADAAAFSFYPGKNLGACGEAGAVTTGDPEVAERVRQLRDHGQQRKYHHACEGTNSRLDALQAAALRIKLRHVETWNRQRRHTADLYRSGLASCDITLPQELADRRHVYHLYVVRHSDRDALQHGLDEAGISTGLHYPIPLHLQPAYSDLGHRAGDFPRAEHWASTGLSLPMFPGMSEAQVERVCHHVAALLA